MFNANGSPFTHSRGGEKGEGGEKGRMLLKRRWPAVERNPLLSWGLHTGGEKKKGKGEGSWVVIGRDWCTMGKVSFF